MHLAIVGRAGALTTLVALTSCGRPAVENAPAAAPARKAGLWEQTLTRDGKAGRLGVLTLCFDAATDRKLSVFGRHFGSGDCQRSVTSDPDGVYHFASTCSLGAGMVVKSSGTASGVFGANYKVHSEVSVVGAPFELANGMHVIDISGRYKGPCPAGMRPGDASLGSGLKVNIDRLPQIAQAMTGS